MGYMKQFVCRAQRYASLKARLLEPLEYAVVKDLLTGEVQPGGIRWMVDPTRWLGDLMKIGLFSRII